ncbi:Succinate dehydrogenase cytochrome b subunit [hydrothermal vent metagenome]|uniref:Succinate dehydrogenase cytochrome b subunit n=1 Tax=hydrothermal vent metagenome TaxID=652676 RepID=A0A3B0VNR5_9ZZZZ
MNRQKIFIFSSIGRKALVAVSGAFLGFFLFLHLLGNSAAFWGAGAFISYAAGLHSLPVPMLLFEIVLLSFFIIHILLAIVSWYENLRARPERYACHKNAGGRTWGSRTMPYTGVIILLFVIVHLSAFWGTKPAAIAALVRHNLSRPLTASYYLISLAALTLHVSHGFWSLWQSLGLGLRHTDLLRKSSLIISITGGLLFSLIPLLCLLSADFLR